MNLEIKKKEVQELFNEKIKQLQETESIKNNLTAEILELRGKLNLINELLEVEGKKE